MPRACRFQYAGSQVSAWPVLAGEEQRSEGEARQGPYIPLPTSDPPRPPAERSVEDKTFGLKNKNKSKVVQK